MTSRGRIYNEEGAILITVMLTVAIMSVVAIATIDQIRFSVRMTTNATATNQARWLALGSEAWAAQALAAWREHPDSSEDGNTVADERLVPIEGFEVHARLAPLANCFNLNSLVKPDAEGILTANTVTIGQFKRLLGALGISSSTAERLAAATVDWVDPDSETMTGGAEDYEYSGLAVPYRTGNVPMANASELRAIKGFTRELYETVRPHVCALPQFAANPINLNALETSDMVLLSMIFGDTPLLPALSIILQARPAGGYQEAEDIWSISGLSELEIAPENKELLDIKSRYYFLETEVSADQAFVEMRSLFDTQSGAMPTLVWREFGEDS